MTMATGQQVGVQETELFALPASYVQRRIWSLDRQNPGNPVFNVGVRGWLEGPLDLERLRQALRSVVQRHEALRTRFAEIDGALRQVIEDEPSVRFEVIDLAHLPQEQVVAQVDQLSTTETRKPFDLAQPVILRVVVIRVSASKSMLLVTAHQSVADGWSMGSITADLAKAYSQPVDTPEPLPPLELQYGDFAIWQDAWMKSEEALSNVIFWRRSLAGGSATTLPPASEASTADSTDADILSKLLPRKLTDSMIDLAHKEGTTFFVVALAALGVLLARRLGSGEFCIGTQVSNRDQVEFESVVGAFANNVILRLRTDSKRTVRELINDYKSVVLDALAHQSLPFEAVLNVTPEYACGPTGSPFDINFLCQRGFVKPLAFGDVTFTPVPSRSQGAIFPINVFIVERAEGWRLNCEYKKSQYDAAFGETLLLDYEEILNRFVSCADTPIRDLTGGSGFQASRSEPADDARPVPVSVQQKRFWMLSQLGEGAAFHLPGVLRISGDLDLDRFRQALQHIVDRHQSLRTSFRETSGQLVQLISPLAKLDIAVRDLRSCPPSDDDLQKLLRDEAMQPFDLSSAPLLRCTLFWLGDREYVFAFTLSHLIADGWSTGVIQRELREIYGALHGNAQPGLAAIRCHYGDFATWQREWINTDKVREQVDSAMEQLQGDLPVLDIPTDWPTYPKRPTVPAKVSIRLSPELVKAAKQLCAATGSTPFMLFLAAFKALLHRYSGGTDILVGSTIANRVPLTQESIGPFSNPICLRSDVAGSSSFRDWLGRVKETTMHALDQGDTPFELLMESVSARSIRGRSPLFQFYFLYQAAFVQGFEAGGLRFSPMRAPSGGLASEFSLLMLERADGLSAQLEYNAALYSEDAARSVLRHLERLLQSAVENPDCSVRELAANTPQELELLDAGDSLHPLAASLAGAKQTDDRGPGPVEAHDIHVASNNSLVAPETPAEAKIAEIFGQVLGVSRVGATDDFFDLGGHSLMAVRAIGLINTAFACKLPVGVLFQAQTARELAAALQRHNSQLANAGEAQWPILIPIQPNGTRSPLFCVARPNVNALGYLMLSRRLDPDQPVYGLQVQMEEDPALDFTPEQYRTTARDYIHAIRSLQPHGPYNVIGLCQGAYIAFEMARQLENEGERLNLLGVLDTWTEENTRRKSLFLAAMAMRRLRAKRSGIFKSGLRRLAEKIFRAASKDGDKSAREQKRSQMYWPGKDFQPPVVSAMVTVFRVRNQPFWRIRDITLGWGSRSLSGVRTEIIPGEHLTLLREPHVELLAGRIAACMGAEAKH